MTKKKKMLILGILLLVLLGTGVVAYTYSRYMSRATGTADLKVATWAVKVNNTDIVQSTNFVFDENNITWSQSDYIEEGYIAPSRTGTIRLRLDTTGSKVAVKYTISADTSILDNYKQINITKINGQPATNGNYTGVISLDNVDTPIDIPIEIAWENDSANNESDTTIGTTITKFSIPITVTAEQKLVEDTYCLDNGFNKLSDCMLVSEAKSKTVDEAKSQIAAKGTPDFSKVSTTADGLYSTLDDEGTSYYYRGDVRNNYVSYAGYIWRIIRENGDGSVRMIYSGRTTSAIGAFTSISESEFNIDHGDAKDIGYKYDENQTNSTIKNVIDNWYETNILNKKDISGQLYSGYISDGIFCNDRGVASSAIDAFYYSSFSRIREDYNPLLRCNQDIDKFSVSVTKGNAQLQYPIGLITADEVSMAGGKDNSDNTNYYLYTGEYYWTMSPSAFRSWTGHSTVWRVGPTGALAEPAVSVSLGVRPVINLSSDVLISGGDGTAGNPYTLKLA